MLIGYYLKSELIKAWLKNFDFGLRSISYTKANFVEQRINLTRKRKENNISNNVIIKLCNG